MSLTRRLAAGLPVVGVAVFAALTLGVAPASAASDGAAARAAQPAVMTTPCTGSERDCPAGDGYDTPGGTATGDSGPVRGHHGYGSVGPSTTPTTPATTPATTTPTPTGTTPTGTVESVPPTGVSPTTVSPSPSSSTPGHGVSPAHTLPLTGAPSAGTIGLGALLVAAGVGAIWYTRRRRSA